MAEKNIGRVVPNYKGDYDASAQYAKLDVVYHDDSKSSYVALADTRGENPYTTPSKWGVVARAKYQVGQQDLEAAVQAVINKSGVHIKGANAALGFSQDPNAADTSTIKEVAPGTLSVSGNLNVLGNLNGNANSARALDHDIAINGQNIKTASGASNTLLADPQVTPINAGADLGVAATYPKVNARYSITGKYTNSPDDSITWGHTLDVSSSLNGNLSLTLNGPGDRYVASISSGTFSGWTKVVSGDIGGRNLLLGTGSSFTGVGDNSTNGNFDAQGGRYYLASGKKVSDLYNQYGPSQYLTISFDWEASGDNISGQFNPQWSDIPWIGLAEIGAIKPSDTNKSGHFKNSVQLNRGGYSSGMATGIQFRQDNLQGNITISNLKLEAGNVATDWTPAPEDVDNRYLKNSRQLPAEARDFNYLATHMQTYQGTWWTSTEEILNGPTSGWTWATVEVVPGNAETTGTIRTMRHGIGDTYSANVNNGELGTWAPLNQASRTAPFTDFSDVANNMKKYQGTWITTTNILNGPVAINFGAIIHVIHSWDDAGLIVLSDHKYRTWVGLVSAKAISGWTLISNDTNVVHNTGNETIAGDKSLTGNTTLANVKTSSVKTGTVTANGLRMDFREFAAGVEVWFTGTFTGDASYSWHDLGQMPSNITKPFSFVTAVMGGRSGIGGVSTQTDMLLMVHINNTGKIQYQLRHGVENNTTDYKGVVLYVEGSTSYFK